ncbi:MAG: hypothetical protein HY912_08860 [Desulfomonile tiedjei]|uniref:PsbP C-terminal domain-containing protein n=1 Tax=Desulfomonile tiedjei TaxID=2358 RepID=A0A9D6V022_9BACT|nr:hypothetical protein [Desulfomonile tiedjei]
MNLPRINFFARILLMITVFVAPAVCHGEDFKVFTSEEYGFTMKYPATWVKVEPKGNYYVVFQAPDLTDNFRNRIHVAAHKPVKDPLEVFLKELRNGIADLQKGSGKKTQEVRIIDEGEFKCEVPGAYYFFIQAFDDKLRIWMDIVIVFFKQDQTLLRISCLAPSQSMEKFQSTFNEVLVSIKFASQGASGGAPLPQRPLETIQPPAPTTMQPVPPPPPRPQTTYPPTQTPQPPVQPGMIPESAPEQPRRPSPEMRLEQQPAPQVQPAPVPRPGPRGPLRGPEGPSTGIVN